MPTYTVSYAGIVEADIQSDLPSAADVHQAIVSGALLTSHFSPGMHITVRDAAGVPADGSDTLSIQKLFAARPPSDYPYRLRVICGNVEEVVYSDYPAWAYKGWVLEGNSRVRAPAGYVRGVTPVEVIDASGAEQEQPRFAAFRAKNKQLEQQLEQKLAVLRATQKTLARMGKPTA